MLNFNDGKEKQQKILKHRHCLYQYVPLQKRRIWFKSSPTIRRIPASCVTCSTCRHNTWLIISKRSCFKLEKNLNKVFPGKVRDQNTATKMTFAVRDWAVYVQMAENCWLDSFWLHIHLNSWNSLCQGMKIGWQSYMNQVWHYFRGNGSFVLENPPASSCRHHLISSKGQLTWRGMHFIDNTTLLCIVP